MDGIHDRYAVRFALVYEIFKGYLCFLPKNDGFINLPAKAGDIFRE